MINQYRKMNQEVHGQIVARTLDINIDLLQINNLIIDLLILVIIGLAVQIV